MGQDRDEPSKRALSFDSTPLDRRIGANLKTLRETAQLTPAELGEMIDVPADEILAYESGRRRLGAIKMLALCLTLNAKAEDFFLGPKVGKTNDAKK